MFDKIPNNPAETEANGTDQSICHQSKGKVDQKVNVTTSAKLNQKYPQMFSALDIVLNDIQPVEFIVEPLIPVGLTYLGGAPKSGKSIMSQMIAMAVSGGIKLFGELKTQQCEVLLISLEDSVQCLHGRWSSMSSIYPPSNNMRVTRNWADNISDNNKLLSAFLKDNPKIRLVVIDTVGLFYGTLKKGSYESEYLLSSSLKVLATKFNAAILAIHHTTKKVPEDWISGLYGTHGGVAAADSVLYLKSERGTPLAKLLVTGRNIEDISLNLEFNQELCIWEPNNSTPNLKLSPERREIFELLVSAKSPVKLSDIAQAVSKSKTTVQNLLKKLLSLHLVEKTKYGVYQVVDAKKNNRGIVKQSKAMDLMDLMESENSIDLVDLMDSVDFRYPAT